MSRVCFRSMLLTREFVVDLPCTSRMSEAEYREFVIATLAKFDETLGRDAPQGLARAAAEKMTGELCAMIEQLRADNREVKSRLGRVHSAHRGVDWACDRTSVGFPDAAGKYTRHKRNAMGHG